VSGLVVRGLVNAALIGVGDVGMVLAAYAGVAVGLMGLIPQSRRLWGRARLLPRGGFAGYYTGTGLTFYLMFYLILSWRSDPAFWPVMAVEAIMFGSLVAGWIVMRRQPDNDPAATTNPATVTTNDSDPAPDGPELGR
jgi:hypothetical protein